MNQPGSSGRDPHAEGPTPGPFSALLGFRYISVDEVESVVEADPGPEHCNGGGIVHRGFSRLHPWHDHRVGRSQGLLGGRQLPGFETPAR